MRHRSNILYNLIYYLIYEYVEILKFAASEPFLYVTVKNNR